MKRNALILLAAFALAAYGFSLGYYCGYMEGLVGNFKHEIERELG